jgi:hypothetical protein
VFATRKDPALRSGWNIKLFGDFVGRTYEERPVNLKTILLAGAFALSSTFALAQAGGASSAGDAAMPEKSGSSTNSGGMNNSGNMNGGTVGTGTRESGMNGAAKAWRHG